MAVLVQRLVAADSAGVIFTADPRTGNPWRFPLECAFGLAQELVGGTGTTPADRFVLEWHSGRILEKHIARKEGRWVAGAHGLVKEALPEALAAAPSLSDELATGVAQVAFGLDRAFRCRVDVEWVVLRDEIHVVQVRPVTALPAFFPHHLPHPLARLTWRPEWHFFYCPTDDPVTPPIHRDLAFLEAVDYRGGDQALRTLGWVPAVEMDFAGHRYQAFHERPPRLWEETEASLCVHEPAMRQSYLDGKRNLYPAILARAHELVRQVRSLGECLRAFLWVRDACSELDSVAGAPGQVMHGITCDLLRDFVAQHAPDESVDDLLQGYHPDLEPYYPEVQLKEAEALAALVEPGAMRQAFEEVEPAELILHLLRHHVGSPFMQAFDDYCARFGLWTSEWLPTQLAGGRHRAFVGLVQGALRAPLHASARYAEANQRRAACVARFRQRLEGQSPEVRARFDRLHDQALFWGPLLNDRGWVGPPRERVLAVWRYLRPGLVEAGLVDQKNEIAYFTADELARIAETEDVAEGRRILQQRRLEHEEYARLAAPPRLGKPPDPPPEAPPRCTQGAAERRLAADLGGSCSLWCGHGQGVQAGVPVGDRGRCARAMCCCSVSPWSPTRRPHRPCSPPS